MFLRVHTIYVLSKNKKIIIFYLNIFNLTTVKNGCILHGHVFVIKKNYTVSKDQYLSFVVRKPVFEFPTRSDTNRAVQPQKMAGGFKFRI